MIQTILLCGERKEKSIGLALISALSNYGEVKYFNGEKIEFYPGKPELCFLLYEWKNVPEICVEKGILLFKNSFQFREHKKIPAEFMTVFESHNMGAIEFLKGTGATAVACGTSSRDTLSIASIDYQSATVSLQRTIKNLKGEVVEPHDISIKLRSAMSPYPLLACCSALLLSGIPSEKGYYF